MTTSNSHDDADFRRFLTTLQDGVTCSYGLCPADCLLDTHDHRLLATPEGHLSEVMRH